MRRKIESTSFVDQTTAEHGRVDCNDQSFEIGSFGASYQINSRLTVNIKLLWNIPNH